MAQKDKEEEQSMDKMWGETTVSVDALKEGRGKLFDESNFGMFIHWGLFSHLGGKWKDKTYYGIGEWIKNPAMAGIPTEEYMAIAKEFNPSEFDVKKIAKLAKDAGMKYIIITSKHHEGFAMFDSKVSDFNIVDATPFGRDPMKELSDACHELGLGFGFYYTQPGLDNTRRKQWTNKKCGWIASNFRRIFLQKVQTSGSGNLHKLRQNRLYMVRYAWGHEKKTYC